MKNVVSGETADIPPTGLILLLAASMNLLTVVFGVEISAEQADAISTFMTALFVVFSGDIARRAVRNIVKKGL